MAKVLVTGGIGFIGSHIVDALREKGHNVRLLDIICREKGLEVLGCFKNIDELRCYYDCDIRNYKELEKVFIIFRPEYVIHCAARARIQPSLAAPIDTYEVNVMGTLNLLELSKKYGVKKIVYSGSSSVYAGHGADELPLSETLKPLPLNPYADSKLMAEMLIERYVKTYDLKAVILRYFNVYGPRQPSEGQYATIIGIFLNQLKNKEPMTIVPDGLQRRDFTWVGDVVDANILAMESDKVHQGEIINIGSGKNYSIIELADMVGGAGYPKIMIKPRIGEARATLADISQAKMLLNWEPKVSLEQGIKLLKEQR